MKQSFILQVRVKELFPGSGSMRKFAFRTTAKLDKSVLFQKEDCFEHLSPHVKAE